MTIFDGDDWADEDLQELIAFSLEYAFSFEAKEIASHVATCIEVEIASDSGA